MKNVRSSSLRSILTEAAPILVLPPRVLQQLVGYYRDWRLSRDIFNEAAETSAEHQRAGTLRAGQSRFNASSS